MAGRETGWACFQVCLNTKVETIRGTVAGETAEEACIFTDENRSCLWLENEKEPRTRNAIDHSEGWTTGQDGDSIREVHVHATRRNPASLRNRLRRFRGVHKDRLSGHVAMFELASSRDQVTPALLQRMRGVWLHR
ncbi:hypothetical protein [Salinibacter ruber]|uniref:hypothetical protein n=1 Tax=Salinibacter ruber TaxID=146919 RepID=UPI002169874A|nr:hypothetical protein [Salinibacter ruber]MCS4198069.1 transposase-like protein [Salinibacter ruber]